MEFLEAKKMVFFGLYSWYLKIDFQLLGLIILGLHVSKIPKALEIVSFFGQKYDTGPPRL